MTKTATSSKNLFTFNHINKTIVGTEHHFNQAGIPDSTAYKALMAAMAMQPTYSLAPIASTKKVEKKQTYKGLNMELMAFHISQKGNEEAKAEFKHMVEQKIAYPTIKSCFLELYPNIEVAKTQRAMAQKDLADRKATVRNAKAGFRIFSLWVVCRLPLLLDDDGRENRHWKQKCHFVGV